MLKYMFWFLKSKLKALECKQCFVFTFLQAVAASSFPAGIFAGTKISPEALKQTLKFEEPPDVPTPAQKGNIIFVIVHCGCSSSLCGH